MIIHVQNHTLLIVHFFGKDHLDSLWKFNIKMIKSIYYIIFLILFVGSVYSENDNVDTVRSGNIKLKENINKDIYEDNFTNFPFRFGTEFLYGISFNSDFKSYPGFLIFVDINLSKNLAFLKLEYGNIYESDRENSTHLTSLGLNYNILKGRRNNLYLHAAGIAFWNSSSGGGIGGGVSGFLSIRYLHSFSNYFGIISSIRYPFGNFNNIALTAGIQFFTK